MDDKEYNDFKNKVADYGVSQQSYIMDSINKGKIKTYEEMRELKGISADFAIYVRQLRGLANNVNQMTHVLHTSGYVPEEAELKRTSATLMKYMQEGERIWQSIRSSISQ
ncbi:MAG: MobC family plasmid mobilization relaxosome protein [Lachnospiraceae bacterium]|nr:MobC family plasmid mobilization relaxosome protein [Lachnospiraceae bacterium]